MMFDMLVHLGTIYVMFVLGDQGHRSKLKVTDVNESLAMA